MKRILSVLLLLVVLMPLAAATSVINPEDNKVYAAMLEPYENHDVRTLAMGGAGLVFPQHGQTVWLNPAGLAEKKFTLSVPGVSAESYAIVMKLLAAAAESESSAYSYYIPASYLYGSNKGYSDIMDIQSSFSLTAGGFGIGAALQVSTPAYITSSSSPYGKYYARINFDVRTGYGYRINILDALFIDLGVTAGINYNFYSNTYELSSSSSHSTSSSSDVVYTSWAIPVNAGLRISHKTGFAIATTVNNLNGKYYLNSFVDGDTFSENPFAKSGYSYKTPFTWNAGLGWSLPESVSSLVRLTVEADFKDIKGFIDDKDYSVDKALEHLAAGVEFGLSVINLRAGYSNDYITTGVGFDFGGFRLETAYLFTDIRSAIKGTYNYATDRIVVSANVGW